MLWSTPLVFDMSLDLRLESTDAEALLSKGFLFSFRGCVNVGEEAIGDGVLESAMILRFREAG